MAAVKTLGVEVAVVDAAVCRHKDVGQAAGRVSPVHHTEGEGGARPSIVQPVSVGGERDGVTVTAPPHCSPSPSPSLPGQQMTAGAGHRVTAAAGRTARLRGDHIAVGGGLLHGQAGGGRGGGGGGGHSGTRRRYQHCDEEERHWKYSNCQAKYFPLTIQHSVFYLRIQ